MTRVLFERSPEKERLADEAPDVQSNDNLKETVAKVDTSDTVIRDIVNDLVIGIDSCQADNASFCESIVLGCMAKIINLKKKESVIIKAEDKADHVKRSNLEKNKFRQMQRKILTLARAKPPLKKTSKGFRLDIEDVDHIFNGVFDVKSKESLVKKESNPYWRRPAGTLFKSPREIRAEVLKQVEDVCTLNLDPTDDSETETDNDDDDGDDIKVDVTENKNGSYKFKAKRLPYTRRFTRQNKTSSSSSLLLPTVAEEAIILQRVIESQPGDAVPSLADIVCLPPPNKDPFATLSWQKKMDAEKKVNKFFHSCLLCPDESVNLTKTEKDDKLTGMVRNYVGHQNYLRCLELTMAKQSGNSLKQYANSRPYRCSSMSHPNFFHDTSYQEDENRFRIFDDFGHLTFLGVNNFLELATPSMKRECQCKDGMMCKYCKYFFYAVSTIAHHLNQVLSKDVGQLCLVNDKLIQIYNEDSFAKDNDLMCKTCKLPLVADELIVVDNNVEYADFPDCSKSMTKAGMAKSTIDLMTGFEMLDLTLYNYVTNALIHWHSSLQSVKAVSSTTNCHQDVFGFEEIKAVLLQMARIAIPLNAIANAFTHLSSVLLVMPSFIHEDFTCEPINTVLSIHRLHNMLQFFIVDLLPMSSIENGDVSESDRDILRKRPTQVVQLREVCRTVDTTCGSAIYALEELYLLVKHYAPLEIVVNLHRIDNIEQFKKYVDSFTNRGILVQAFSSSIMAIKDFTECVRNSLVKKELLTEADTYVFNKLETMNTWLLALYTGLLNVRRDARAAIIDSSNKKSSAKHSQTSQMLYELQLHCSFCGIQPKKRSLQTCQKCDVANYCNEECLAKYKPYHNIVCCKKGGRSGVLRKFTCLQDHQIQDIVTANKKLIKNQPVTKVLVTKPTQYE